MKIAKYLLLALVFFKMSVGCSYLKDKKLTGTWASTAGGCGSITLTLKPDHSGTLEIMGEREYFTWETKGNTLILKFPDRIIQGDYVLENDTLIIRTPGKPDVVFYKQE